MTDIRTIIVLGMHRSGTSCLTGMLEEAGLVLGDVSRSNPYNLKGNCENNMIMALHNDLLESNGGSWDNPPESVEWLDRHRKARDRIIAGYKNVACWGFKDPRTLLVLDGWLEALPDSRFIGTFRDPLLVAGSLYARNGFPLEKGMQLWSQYNCRLCDYQSKYGFPIVSFDDEKDTYIGKVTRILGDLGLRRPAGGFLFFDGKLRTAPAGQEVPVPANVAELYAKLRQCSV